MTKKDFELIANAIADSGLDPVNKARVARSLAARLKLDNPRFDADRFIEWCLS